MMKKILLTTFYFAVCVIGKVPSAHAEQKKDLRGARPGMNVAEAVAAVEKDGGTCGDAMDIRNMPFIRSQNRRVPGSVFHEDVNSNAQELGIVYCTFKTGMSPESPYGNFMPDRINLATSKTVKGLPKDPSMPKWEDIQDATVLTVNYNFYSRLNGAEITKLVLEEFDKKPSDVHGLRNDDPTEILKADGTIWRGMPQILLGDDLKLSVGVNLNSASSRGYNVYTLQLNNDVLTRNFIKSKANSAEAERISGPRPKF